MDRRKSAFWKTRREGVRAGWDAAKQFAKFQGRTDVADIRDSLDSLISVTWINVLETELCARFIKFAAAVGGWTAYAETGSYDILMVASDGTQFGIHAKKRFNAQLLRQSLADSLSGAPDYRGILIPGMTRDVFLVCGHLKLVPIFPDDESLLHFFPDLKLRSNWPQWETKQRIKLPEYVPDVIAGSKNPIVLSEWKVKALRIAAMLQTRGFLTIDDFDSAGFSPDLWIEQEWLSPDGSDERFIGGPRQFPYAKQHPQVYQQILADVGKRDESPRLESDYWAGSSFTRSRIPRVVRQAQGRR